MLGSQTLAAIFLNAKQMWQVPIADLVCSLKLYPRILCNEQGFLTRLVGAQSSLKGERLETAVLIYNIYLSGTQTVSVPLVVCDLVFFGGVGKPTSW